MHLISGGNFGVLTPKNPFINMAKNENIIMELVDMLSMFIP
jgi:hypothetical protein